MKTITDKTLKLPAKKQGAAADAARSAHDELAAIIATNVAATRQHTADDTPPPAAEPQATLPTIQPPETRAMSTQDSAEAQKPQRQIHTVRLESEHFEDYAKRRLNAQTRNNDRHYQSGDILIQKEYDPFLNVHTGRELISVITNIRQTPGLEPGFVLMHTKALT